MITATKEVSQNRMVVVSHDNMVQYVAGLEPATSQGLPERSDQLSYTYT